MQVGVIGLGNIGGHVATNLVADANGLFKFVDMQARTLPMRFFRARTP